MRTIVLLLALLLGLADARRRGRSTTTTTTTSTTIGSLPTADARQLGFAGQPEELEGIWQHIDIQKLDRQQHTWKDDGLSRSNGTSDDSLKPGRQFYPGFPGDTNELPSPITPPQLPPLPPSTAPGCLGLRGQFPSSKSCANYLNCWDDVVIEQTCPGGLLFNDLLGVCDFDFNVHCGNRPPPTPKPPLAPGSKMCPDPNGRYRSSANCSEFYVCLTGRPIKFSCPRGLVYNDELNVCDYTYKVDCQGAATPKPQPPATYPPPRPSKVPEQSTYPPEEPSYPPQQPSYAPPPPTFLPPQSTYPPQPPTYPPQQPTYPPQQPSYPPQQPSYPPQSPAYPPQQPAYPANPWLNKLETDPWHQRPVATQLEIEKQRQQQEAADSRPPSGQQDVPAALELSNPWNVVQGVPAGVEKAPCEEGEVHRLNESCSNVVVCRNGRPQVVQCPLGFTYDKPSGSCQPFSVAKC
ncbi:hypothetical protein KM043_015461 [Ampulex compressa]|nr:hypothetical protein KM043_015461 [Ampulex compressa]